MTTTTVTTRSVEVSTRSGANKRAESKTKKTQASSRPNTRGSGSSSDPSSSGPSGDSRNSSYGSRSDSTPSRSSTEAEQVQNVLRLRATGADRVEILLGKKNNVSARTRHKQTTKSQETVKLNSRKRKHDLTIKIVPLDDYRLVDTKTPSTGVSPSTITRKHPAAKSIPRTEAISRSTSIATTANASTRHLSIKSLREARLHHLLDEMNKGELGSDTNVLRDHYCLPPVHGHLDAARIQGGPTIQPVREGAPGGGSNPYIYSSTASARKRRKLRPNVYFRLAQIEAHELAHL